MKRCGEVVLRDGVLGFLRSSVDRLIFLIAPGLVMTSQRVNNEGNEARLDAVGRNVIDAKCCFRRLSQRGREKSDDAKRSERERMTMVSAQLWLQMVKGV